MAGSSAAIVLPNLVIPLFDSIIHQRVQRVDRAPGNMRRFAATSVALAAEVTVPTRIGQIVSADETHPIGIGLDGFNRVDVGQAAR